LLEAPAVIALEDVGDGEHQVERAFVISIAADGIALQRSGELKQFELRQPIALLKGGKGVVELKRAELVGGAGLRTLQQRAQPRDEALNRGEQRTWGKAPKGSDTPFATRQI